MRSFLHQSLSVLTYDIVSAEQKKQWCTDCYDHYLEPEIVVEKGVVKYRFTCRVYVFRPNKSHAN